MFQARIKKGDEVTIWAGKDRGKKGKVIKVIPREERVVIEGTNLRSRHVRPRKQGEKGQVVRVPSPLSVSNVRFICPKCGKPTRIGTSVVEGKKIRICKKCQNPID